MYTVLELCSIQDWDSKPMFNYNIVWFKSSKIYFRSQNRTMVQSISKSRTRNFFSLATRPVCDVTVLFSGLMNPSVDEI